MTNRYIFSVIPFSTRLVLTRMSRQLTQAEVASGAEIDQALISRYEKGLAPTQENVEKLETFFGIKFDDPKVEEAFGLISGQSLSLAA